MPRPTPLFFGEFGVPVRRRTDEQLASYVAGVLNVCAEHAIDLAFYWQLYDNEYDRAVDGKRNYRGFGLFDVERRVTSVYFLFRFGL